MDLTRTKVALVEYDRKRAALEAELEEAWSDTSPKGSARILGLTNKIEALGEAVGIAFGHDTAEINSMSTCRACVRPGPAVPKIGCGESFVRRCVRRWEQES